MLKRTILKFVVAAMTIASALGLAGWGLTAASAATSAPLGHPLRANASAQAQGHSNSKDVEIAAPATGTGCNPDPVSPVTECTTVVGTGLKISSISGWTVNETFGTFNKSLHIEIYGPQGHLGNCNPFSLGPLATGPTCVWRNPHPNVNRKGGNYCSRVWRLAGGHYSVLSAECVKVHR